MQVAFNKLSFFIILAIHLVAISEIGAELKLLSVVFRHGDRAPDNNGLEMYPNDPYINDSFNPMGLGGLTNNGKRREYFLGKHLRMLYGDFLGDTYYKEELTARSTNVDRTKMSLQLVLASLYPPKNNQTWNQFLNWQPIPSTYVPSLDDILMVPEECPKYLEAREKVENSKEFKAELASFKPWLTKWSNDTGKSIANSNDMYFLFHALMAERSMGLKLPLWTQGVFPRGKLHDGILLEYKIFSYNEEMRRLNGGMLLNKFILDMEDYVSGKLDNRQKIFVYSGHETNVAAVLQALGVYKPHVPEYGSGVFVELHKIDLDYFVKVRYYKGFPYDYERMLVPGCAQKCKLDQFKRALSRVIPSGDDFKCDKRSLRPLLQQNKLKVASGIVKQILDAIRREDEANKEYMRKA